MMQSSRYTYYHPSREEAKRYADNALKEITAKMDRISEQAGKRNSTPFLTQYESLQWKDLEIEKSIAFTQLEEIEKYAAMRVRRKYLKIG